MPGPLSRRHVRRSFLCLRAPWNRKVGCAIWCSAARDGYTGHMDEYDDEFKRAWASDHKMTGDGLLWYKGAWPYEGGGYWFDGLARLGYALHDEALVQQAKRRLYAVADHMNADGLLFLWWLNRNNRDDRKAVAAALDGWPLWACGLLGRAMTGYYAASEDKHILQALETGLRHGPRLPAVDHRQHVESVAGIRHVHLDRKPRNRRRAGRHVQRRKHGACCRICAVTAKRRASSRGRRWTTLTWSNSSSALRRGPSAICGRARRSYLEAAVGWHDLLERIAMQPHGVPVADEWYLPTGAFRGSETCDVAGYVWSQVSLLSVTGEGRMGDRAERAFFNAGPATVSRDFKTHVYFQSPNRFANQLAGLSPWAEGRRRHLSAEAWALVLHRRTEPHRSLVRDPHVDGHVRQRPGGHLLRPLQGDGAGGGPRAGRDRLQHRLSLQRNHRDIRAAGAGGGLPA